MINIVLDAGHGLPDPGAVGPTGTTEEALALDVCRRTMRRINFLDTEDRTVVHMTRLGRYGLLNDKSADLQARCDFANNLPADVFVSVHANAHERLEAIGFECFTSPGHTPADVLATGMLLRFRETFPDRVARLDYSDGDPDKEAKFRVLVGTHMPAVLFELGFISNPEEEQWLLSLHNRISFADVFAQSILGFLGLVLPESGSVVDSPRG